MTGTYFGANMITFLLVVHIMIAIAMVASVLLQRSEGGALGIGGGGGFMTGRGAANALTRTTTALALGFFLTSILLTIVARQGGSGSLLEGLESRDSLVPGSITLPLDDERPETGPAPMEAPAPE